MKKTACYFLVLFIALLQLIVGQGELFAQDEGTPAVRRVAFTTVGGGAAGAAFGAALWLADPLSESADLKNSSLTGMGIGSLAGLVYGIMLLQRTMILPGGYEEEAPKENDFEGARRFSPTPSPSDLIATEPQKKGVPILEFNYRF